MGPDEFDWIGFLSTWSMADRAQLIQVPTLLTNGEDEGADNLSQQEFQKLIKTVTWVSFLKSTHMALLEEEGKYIKVVDEFLRS